jgi:hypothetical protein
MSDFGQRQRNERSPDKMAYCTRLGANVINMRSFCIPVPLYSRISCSWPSFQQYKLLPQISLEKILVVRQCRFTSTRANIHFALSYIATLSYLFLSFFRTLLAP